jgi:hypothetical protein
MVADGLDYFAAPIFSSPLVGDVFDSIVISIFTPQQRANYQPPLT